MSDILKFNSGDSVDVSNMSDEEILQHIQKYRELCKANPDWNKNIRQETEEKDLEIKRNEYKQKLESEVYDEISKFIWEGKTSNEIIQFYKDNIAKYCKTEKDFDFGKADDPINDKYLKEFWTEENLRKIISKITEPINDEPKVRDMPGYITLKEAMEFNEPVQWIIKDLIAEQSVYGIFGEPGCGKTYALFDLAIHIASGIDWLGFEVKKPVPVLVIDQESGKDRVKRRLKSVNRSIHAESDAPVYVKCFPNKFFDKEEDAKTVLSFIRETGAKFILIDSYAATMFGDENSKQDSQLVANNLKKIAEYGKCAILMIHHPNKGGTSERGSSAFRGAVDIMFEVTNDNNILTFRTTKQRDIPKTTWQAEAHFKKQPDETIIYSLSELDVFEAKNRLKPQEEYIIQFLTKNGNSTINQIADSTNEYKLGVLKKFLYSLIENGKIHRVDEGGSGKRAIYGV